MANDLNVVVYQNRNPKDLLKDVNYYGWFNFQKFIDNSNNPTAINFRSKGSIINTNEGKPITNNIIAAYNAQTTPPLQISQVNIIAAQKFHNKTDPNVLIDEGWVGTQTRQLKFPALIFFYTAKYLSKGGDKKTMNKETLVEPIHGGLDDNGIEWYSPVIWGNKRYVIESKKIHDIWEKNKSTISKSSENVKNNSDAYALQGATFSRILSESGPKINDVKEYNSTIHENIDGITLQDGKYPFVPARTILRNYNQTTDIGISWGDNSPNSISQNWFSKQPPKPTEWPIPSIIKTTPTQTTTNIKNNATLKDINTITNTIISKLPS